MLTSQHAPAMHAVMKQDMFAFQRARNMFCVTSFVLTGHTTFQTPTATARVDRLEKPHSAYVPSVLERSYKRNDVIRCRTTALPST